MAEMKAAALCVAIVWAFWSVAMWLLFTFLSQTMIFEWPTNVRLAFVVVILGGLVPTFGITAIFVRVMSEEADNG